MPPPVLHLPLNTSTPLRERIEWLTDVQTSRVGTELRTVLRSMPRRIFTISSIFSREGAAILRANAEYTVSQGHWAIPDGEYELLTAKHEAEHLTPRGNDVKLTLQLLLKQNNETPPVYTAKVSTHWSFPALSRANGRDAFKESVLWSANDFDDNHLRTRALRYKKRTLTATITLFREPGRDEITPFRGFLHVIKGRHGVFRFAHPADNGVLGYWHLAHDAVELIYHTKDVVECEFRMIEGV